MQSRPKQKKSRIGFWTRFVVALLVSVCVLPSCKTIKGKEPVTIIPERIVDKEPSWEGNTQDSGIKGIAPDGKGFEISQLALDRYNGLILLYGATLVPPVTYDYGVLKENGKIFLSAEGMTHFLVLNSKYKNGVKP